MEGKVARLREKLKGMDAQKDKMNSLLQQLNKKIVKIDEELESDIVKSTMQRAEYNILESNGKVMNCSSLSLISLRSLTQV